jgi:hypothetical protein
MLRGVRPRHRNDPALRAAPPNGVGPTCPHAVASTREGRELMAELNGVFAGLTHNSITAVQPTCVAPTGKPLIIWPL